MRKPHLHPMTRTPALAGAFDNACFQFWRIFVGQEKAADKCGVTLIET